MSHLQLRQTKSNDGSPTSAQIQAIEQIYKNVTLPYGALIAANLSTINICFEAGGGVFYSSSVLEIVSYPVYWCGVDQSSMANYIGQNYSRAGYDTAATSESSSSTGSATAMYTSFKGSCVLALLVWGLLVAV
ncbi:hypothetical protein BD324DRAFT_622165 [Kockovaella imperatae]|uniref:Uncharacterized protein n=1 Tax=Kockovaella imperatae TaxID=4999 RepID=A0A1Y1UNN4_9TREE|nr:hypothetical protein BD324DRAFT_622165 [Kockovaella imperatae]ORX38745.1 hypothetical protein BD324DRAFT_622165 [Kockovaella imperatae]